MDVLPKNNAVTFAGSGDGNSQHVVSKIEDILDHIINALGENRVLTIPLRSRRSSNEISIQFPTSRLNEVKRFTCLLQILHMCHEALVSGYITTKRNIYYQYPDLFGSQQYVDRLVDDIAFTFGVGRNALNIVAASKGLVAGKVLLTLGNDIILDCSSNSSVGIWILSGESHHWLTNIDRADGIRRVDIGDAKWIMVIEKEVKEFTQAIGRLDLIAALGHFPQSSGIAIL
ncbi:hypothetical protein Hte_007212 [Hypoxylon texense]